MRAIEYEILPHTQFIPRIFRLCCAITIPQHSVWLLPVPASLLLYPDRIWGDKGILQDNVRRICMDQIR